MTAKLSVISRKQSNNSYFAMCPELKGCYTQGDTYEEALENLNDLAVIILKEEADEEIKREIFVDKINIYSDMIVEI